MAVQMRTQFRCDGVIPMATDPDLEQAILSEMLEQSYRVIVISRLEAGTFKLGQTYSITIETV